MAHRGEVRILAYDWRIECRPWMLVEPAANHLPVFRPFVVCVERCMDSDESLTVIVDEREHVCFLAVVHVQLSGRACKDKQVEIVQILRISPEVFLCEQ